MKSILIQTLDSKVSQMKSWKQLQIGRVAQDKSILSAMTVVLYCNRYSDLQWYEEMLSVLKHISNGAIKEKFSGLCG